MQHSLLPTIHTENIINMGIYMYVHGNVCLEGTFCIVYTLLTLYFDSIYFPAHASFIIYELRDCTYRFNLQLYSGTKCFIFGFKKFILFFLLYLFIFLSFILFLAPRRCIVRLLVQLCKIITSF